MRQIGRLVGPRARSLAFGLALVFPLASAVEAAPITYSTQGQIGPGTYSDPTAPGIQGQNVISFRGVTDGTFTDPSSRFSLGDFVVAPLPPGSVTFYNNTAFSIDLTTNLGGNVVPSNASEVPYSSLKLSGALFGVVIGDNTSGVVAWIQKVEPNPPTSISDPPTPPLQPILDLPFDLTSLDVSRPMLLGSASLNGGQTTFNSVPEPTTIALFLMTLTGVGLRARSRSHRKS